jgi:hypothetical protein
MDPLKSFKRKASRTNRNSQQTTPANQSSTTDAQEPRRRLFSQMRSSDGSAAQLQDGESDDQGMGFDEDDGDQINATIDQNNNQIRNAEFDETDSEDTGKSPEDMEDPDLFQMRRESRQWDRGATFENVWEEMKRLVAFDTDLNQKEKNLGKYRKTKQRGLNDNDKRDRKICRYRLKWARKRYWHDAVSSGTSLDADATAEEPSGTAPEGIASVSHASPDQQHRFASTPEPTSNQQSTPSSPNSDASMSGVRGIIQENKTIWSNGKIAG